MDCCLTNTDAHVTGGSEDGHIYFWDLVDAQVVSSFRAHSSVVKSLLFSIYVFLVSFLLYSLSHVERLWSIFVIGQVTSVSYHPKDDCMISASVDGTIKVWKP